MAAEEEDRIDRMAAEGAISARQAAMLRSSLGGPPAAPPPDRRRSLGRALVWGAAVCVFVAALAALLASGGPPGEVQDVAATLNDAGGQGEMNRTATSIMAVALLFALPLLLFVWLHNSLVAKEEAVSEAWAQVESNFQRRADLVPALVESVSRYMRHERETLTEVTAERTGSAEKLGAAVDRLLEAQRDAAGLLTDRRPTEDQDRLDRLLAVERAVSGRMTEVLALAEDYPDLRASDQFLQLQAQLEGAENRINVARQRFNDAVGAYNGALRKMPWNLVGELGGFRRKAYFRSREGADDAPDLAFD